MVGQINHLTPQIAALNVSISRLTAQGLPANELFDQRDQLVAQLSELVDVRTLPQDHGMIGVLASHMPIVSGAQSLPLRY